MPQDPQAVTIEGRYVVIRVCPTTARMMAADMEASRSAAGLNGRAVPLLRQLVHWWCADRPEDRLGNDSAHHLGGLIGAAQGIIAAFDRHGR